MKEIKILSSEEIDRDLIGLDSWEYTNGRLVKTFNFNEFMDVIYLIVRLSSFFEENNHHADMEIEHRKITFKLSRFDVGNKVTNLDILTARKIEELAREYPKK